MESRFGGMKESVAKAQELYEEGVEKGRELARSASEKSAEALGVADKWMRENPWLALGVAAGVGVLLGLILGSGSRSQSDESERA